MCRNMKNTKTTTTLSLKTVTKSTREIVERGTIDTHRKYMTSNFPRLGHAILKKKKWQTCIGPNFLSYWNYASAFQMQIR